MRARALAVGFVCLATAALSAADGPPVDVAARAKGAAKVVVGTVVAVQARFDVNRFGDQLIVSDAVVSVEETLKGNPSAEVTVTFEGGTIGDLTLNVSDMQAPKRGDRAVMFLDALPSGWHVPHQRGQGVLNLDEGGRVRGADLTLDEVRKRVRGASQ